eukprot:2438466-Pyramimonas_sp.AAC.1
MWLSSQRHGHSSQKLSRASRMEGRPFSNCGSRNSAAHIRPTNMQELHGWRAIRVQNAALA